MLIKEAIEKAVNILTNVDDSNCLIISRKEAIKEVEDILINVLKIKKEQLIIQYKQELPYVYENIFFSNVNDRKKGKPLAYITRNANFYNYNFFVNESCLIPRIDSEILVEKAENYVIKKMKNLNEEQKANKITIKIIDACCGSGCLGISLVKSIFEKQVAERKKDFFIELTLVDISSPAIKVAQLNAQTLLSSYKDNVKIKFIVGDVLQGFSNDFYDIILCNPPYIETSVIQILDKQVKDYEPHLALDGGKDGLKFYRAFQNILKQQKQNFINDNKHMLLEKQVVFFEIGYNQGVAVYNIFSSINFEVKIVKDYGKQDRVAIVR